MLPNVIFILIHQNILKFYNFIFCIILILISEPLICGSTLHPVHPRSTLVHTQVHSPECTHCFEEMLNRVYSAMIIMMLAALTASPNYYFVNKTSRIYCVHPIIILVSIAIHRLLVIFLWFTTYRCSYRRMDTATKLAALRSFIAFQVFVALFKLVCKFKLASSMHLEFGRRC